MTVYSERWIHSPNEKWLQHFKRHANAARDKSKDSTKVGAVLIGKNNEVLLTAFNDHAIGVIDNIERRSRKNGEKYHFASHAEANIIQFAARHGIRTDGLTIYATHFPCPACSNAIVQAGIKCVIVGNGSYVSGTDEVIKRSTSILYEGRVRVIEHVQDSPLLDCAENMVRTYLMRKNDKNGVPLFYHCRDVVESLDPFNTAACSLAPIDLKLVAWLHDIIEDSDGCVTTKVLSNLFSESVVKSVDLLTYKPEEHLNYDNYINDLIESRDVQALLVKLADNYCNLKPSRLAMLDLETQETLKAKYLLTREKLSKARLDLADEIRNFFKQDDYYPPVITAFQAVA